MLALVSRDGSTIRRRSVAATVALAAIAAGVPFALAAEGPSRPGRAGFFSSGCQFTHRLSDDPIVFPGRAGASHRHDFFGNPSTNAASTTESQQGTAGRCNRDGDNAGYWVPTMYKGKQVVRPVRATIYYRGKGRVPQTIEPFPTGLRMIAGDGKAKGPQDPRIVHWNCAGQEGMTWAKPPLCPKGTNLRMSIVFPDCWNGRELDSPDHKSHMAYSVRIGGGLKGCPAGHERAVPSLVINTVYATRGGNRIRLASGPSYTAHGDFFNAWRPEALSQLVRDCLNADVHCAPVRRRQAS